MKSSITDTCRSLRKQGVKGRYVPVENLHLTLAFIGEQKSAGAIREAMEAVPFEKMEIMLDSSGQFRDLLWVGIHEQPALTDYVERLRNELQSRDIPFDSKPFKPHITVIRRARIPDDTKIEIRPVKMTVDRISLMKSERIDGRMKYTEIYVKRL